MNNTEELDQSQRAEANHSSERDVDTYQLKIGEAYMKLSHAAPLIEAGFITADEIYRQPGTIEERNVFFNYKNLLNNPEFRGNHELEDIFLSNLIEEVNNRSPQSTGDKEQYYGRVIEQAKMTENTLQAQQARNFLENSRIRSRRSEKTKSDLIPILKDIAETYIGKGYTNDPARKKIIDQAIAVVNQNEENGQVGTTGQRQNNLHD